MQTELTFTLAKNATKPNPFEIIPVQTTRKENNWKTEEALARAAVTVDRKDQRVQSLMFMTMMIMMTLVYTSGRHISTYSVILRPSKKTDPRVLLLILFYRLTPVLPEVKAEGL